MNFADYFDRVNPVFVVGYQRSGTTLTYRVLNFNEQIVQLPQITYFIPHYWKWRERLPEKVRHKILLAASGVCSHKLRHSIDKETQEELLSQLYNLDKEGDPARIFSFLSFISYSVQSNVSVKWWSEKTLTHLYDWRMLKRWFPKCKFVFCVRDPRAVIASRLGIRRKRGNNSAETYYCLSASLGWLNTIKHGRAIQMEYPDDFCLVCYETLASQPIKVAQQISGFLNLPDKHSAELEEQANKLDVFYQSNTGVVRTGGIDTKSVARWKQLLSTRDVQLIETITKDEASSFGYEFEDFTPVPLGYLLKKQEDIKTYLKKLALILRYKLLGLATFHNADLD